MSQPRLPGRVLTLRGLHIALFPRRRSSLARASSRTGGDSSCCYWAAHGAWPLRGEHVLDGADRPQSRLARSLGVGTDLRCLGIQDVGDQMQDTVGDEDIGLDDLCGVDVLVVARLVDNQLRVLEEGGEFRGVLEGCRGKDFVGDDVVVENSLEGFVVKIQQGSPDRLESLILRREDRDVLLVRQRWHSVRLVEPAQEALQIKPVACFFQPRRWDEEVVNDVYQTALELNIGILDGASGPQTGHDSDGVIVSFAKDDVLPRSDVCVR